MNEVVGIDTIISEMDYVSSDVFVNKYFDSGILFKGYVIGYGYVELTYKSVPPSDLNGWRGRKREVSHEFDYFDISSKMESDRSLDAIKKSLKGLFVDGQTTITVKAGMTLTGITSLFKTYYQLFIKRMGIFNMLGFYINVGEVISDYLESNHGVTNTPTIHMHK